MEYQIVSDCITTGPRPFWTIMQPTTIKADRPTQVQCMDPCFFQPHPYNPTAPSTPHTPSRTDSGFPALHLSVDAAAWGEGGEGGKFTGRGRFEVR